MDTLTEYTKVTIRKRGDYYFILDDPNMEISKGFKHNPTDREIALFIMGNTQL